MNKKKNTATSGKLIKAVYVACFIALCLLHSSYPSTTLPRCLFYLKPDFPWDSSLFFTAGTHCSDVFSGLSLTMPVCASTALSIL